MLPVIAFVVTDIWAKRSGRQTTSRLLREHPYVTLGLLAWGIHHIYLEEFDYAH